MEAAMPAVTDVKNELIELSDIATSTLGGKAFDAIVKQSGFGSTKGADAKAKMIAIVDNQVLPLIKQTFGGAPSLEEVRSLKSSLVDPEASPAQRKAQIEAFFAQQQRNVEVKQRQLGGDQEQGDAGIDLYYDGGMAVGIISKRIYQIPTGIKIQILIS